MRAADEIRAIVGAIEEERAACRAAVLAEAIPEGEANPGQRAMWNSAIEAAADAIRERGPK